MSRPSTTSARGVPAEDLRAPIYTFSLAGYRPGYLALGEHGRYTFGGVTDQGLIAISLLELGRDFDWSDMLKLPSDPSQPDERRGVRTLAN